jgi:hypothetical protein
MNIIESTVVCSVDAGADIFHSSACLSEHRRATGIKSAKWLIRVGDILAAAKTQNNTHENIEKQEPH